MKMMEDEINQLEEKVREGPASPKASVEAVGEARKRKKERKSHPEPEGEDGPASLHFLSF